MKAREQAYDLFVSYNSADRVAVEKLAHKLRERNLRPFLDVWEISPGDSWQERIEDALGRSRACVVVLGPGGVGPWENEEMRVALSQRVDAPSFRVIPLLLPGARLPPRGRLPGFLGRLSWADFRAGLEDEAAFHRLEAGLRRERPGPPAGTSDPSREERPYRGLEVFREEHARFFFGRESLTQHLAEALRESPFLAVVGPSGSGKSSVVRAGLLHALREGALPGSERWRIVALTPGAKPLEELAAALIALRPPGEARAGTLLALEEDLRRDKRTLHAAIRLALAGDAPEVRLLLLVDQFEEVFALCQDAQERDRFIDNLLHASDAAGGRTLLVLTLRADFYARMAEYPVLADRIADRQVVVTPMVKQELEEAIESPALLVGLELEPGLVQVLVREVLGQSGALPLLEHALLELWERRRRGRLTHEAFREIGGVDGAIARRADSEYGVLPPDQQALTRRILFRLVQPGESTGDTRRRARLGELVSDPAEQAAVEEVIGRLSAARLLTVGREPAGGDTVVEVAHEALIRGWPRFREWIEASREALRLQRRIGDRALDWERLGRDEGTLLRGALLAQAAEALNRPEAAPSPLEREYVAASLALREREEAERVETLRKLAQEAEARRQAEEQVARLAAGDLERDGFSRLLLNGVLDEREAVVLRAYCRYLWLIHSPFSPGAIEDALALNPAAARHLLDLFLTRFDPDAPGGREDREAVLEPEIDGALDAVGNFDHDRILRALRNLIDATLRTNYFQTDADGSPRPCLALKLDSRSVDYMLLPRPYREIYIYSPRLEAIHMRGGKVARGGIRWSDRHEDFRTEILGLLKLQMIKNSGIVPVGAKGGFIVKRAPSGPREAVLAEGIECYRLMIGGLLDLTDNFVQGEVIPPPRVVRRDGDDPYLVVAADKGTVTFSDIANGVAAEYGFWMGDTFASGGSAGYDHKHMAITARGAWVAVQRHFRETGRDVMAEDFTAVGVGDMAGDVFGNGMLLSPHIRLVGAFNHQHIFIDPDPDPAASYRERRRLFGLPRSSWADYDRALLSAGGGVFERSAKLIEVSPEAARRLGIAEGAVTPAGLIQHLLRADVDLLWFGGIGTFVKASHEQHAEVGDRWNDLLRVDASELRCRVIGEGANLAMTQSARVEYALRGGRINTDFLDNSAGVGCSDHEVNVKLALDDALARGRLGPDERNLLLREVQDEVADLVLRGNYLQTQAISLEQGPEALEQLSWLMRRLGKAGYLNRMIEFLPDDEDLENRRRAVAGLTRPEIAILLAYAKIALKDQLLASDLPDEPGLLPDLLDYFPRRLEESHRESLERHPLRREISTLIVTNEVIHHMGPAFAARTAADSGKDTPTVVHAYLTAREVLGTRSVWESLQALDGKVATGLQLRMMLEVRHLLEQAVIWFLHPRRVRLSIPAWVARLRPGVESLLDQIPGVLGPADLAAFEERAAEYRAGGVPQDLASSIATADALISACDIVELARSLGSGVEPVARVYFALGERFQLSWLRRTAQKAGETAWQKSASQALIQDLFQCQIAMTSSVLGGSRGLAGWEASQPGLLLQVDHLLSDLRAQVRVDLSMLTVASRRLRDLAAL